MSLKPLVLLVFLWGSLFHGEAWARANDMKRKCSFCHTMHNSQNGNPDVTGIGLQPALLTNTCYGCHSSGNPGNNDTPVVWHIGAAVNYNTTGTESGGGGHNTLPGGDFSWVAQANDLKGHNVAGIATQDPPRAAPGDPALKQYSSSTPLMCAGTNGCHGDLSVASDILAMYQSHHAAELPIDGSTVARSYRFLKGIVGLEEPGYELNASSSVHNQYKGVARGADTDPNTSPQNTTISHSCAVCHGDFHYGAASAGTWDETGTFGTDPWIRHPVDYDMGGLNGEYLGYGPGGAYNIATPLGSTDVSTALSTVTLGSAAGNAIIVCVSCHRAHGSPYDYSLRWDYQGWPSAGYDACGSCHTEKN